MVMNNRYSISLLWDSKNESDWKDALLMYNRLIKPDIFKVDMYMNTLDTEAIKSFTANEFYDFLYNYYFLWFFSNKMVLSKNRKLLKKYYTDDSLSELEKIHSEIFTADHTDIKQCIDVAKQIHGLAASGASGLLAVLFPTHFGVASMPIVTTLQKIRNLKHKPQIDKIASKSSLTDKDIIFLINLMRDKATELNKTFNTSEWTPRKIDMIILGFSQNR